MNKTLRLVIDGVMWRGFVHRVDAELTQNMPLMGWDRGWDRERWLRPARLRLVLTMDFWAEGLAPAPAPPTPQIAGQAKLIEGPKAIAQSDSDIIDAEVIE